MRIHKIRNAAFRIDFGGKTFLVDPVLAPAGEMLSDDNNFLSQPLSKELPFPAKDVIKNIDAVILTHLHPDHFDKFAEDMLPKNTKIFVQDIFDKHALEKSHFSNIEVLNQNGTVFEGINLYKTECIHGVRENAEHIFLANGMRWEAMGVVFKAQSEPSLYLAGDTIWFEGIKKIIDEHKPGYAIVNSGCVKIGREVAVTMGIDDIKKLHEYAPGVKIIAGHLDCIDRATLCSKDIQDSDAGKYTYVPADGELLIFEN